jgi:hypothetical protein
MEPVGRHIARFVTTPDRRGMRAESKTSCKLEDSRSPSAKLQNYEPYFDNNTQKVRLTHQRLKMYIYINI